MLGRLLLLSALIASVAILMVAARAWSRRQTMRLRSGPASLLDGLVDASPDRMNLDPALTPDDSGDGVPLREVRRVASIQR